jgi:RasGEF N-terminal motif
MFFVCSVSESGEKLIKAGTVLKLVEMLTSPTYTELVYREHFVTTFTDFMTPMMLFTLLRRVRGDPPT